MKTVQNLSQCPHIDGRPRAGQITKLLSSTVQSFNSVMTTHTKRTRLCLRSEDENIVSSEVSFRCYNVTKVGTPLYGPTVKFAAYQNYHEKCTCAGSNSIALIIAFFK